MRANRLRERVDEGQNALGFNLHFPAPYVIDMLARTGFDYVLLETQYGAFTFDAVLDMCRAAEAADLAVLAKLPDKTSLTIERFLDAGIWNIQLPHVSTKADAEQAIAACRFAPNGVRTWTGGRPALARRNMSVCEYMEWSNRQVVTILMLETRSALANLDAILEVAGIDFFRYGIGDLALSLGHPGENEHPEVIEHLAQATDKIRRAGQKLFYDSSSFITISQLIRDGTEGFLRDASEGRADTYAWLKKANAAAAALS